MTIVANNYYQAGSINCDNGNPAAVIFSILSPDCPCVTSGYTYDQSVCGCSLCNKTLIGCSLCSSPTICTTCNTTLNYNSTPVNGICKPLTGYLAIIGCNCASNTSNCPSSCGCQTLNNFIMVNSSCVCNSAYLLINTTCVLCSTLVSSCQICSSQSICLTCINNNYAISNSICVLCSILMIGCKTCTNSSICTSCVNNQYVLKNTICIAVCGDGILINAF